MKIAKRFLLNIAFVSLITGAIFTVFIIFGVNPLARELENKILESESHSREIVEVKRREESIKNIVLVIVPLIGLLYILYLWLYISRNIVRPLGKAVRFSNQLANGEFPAKLQAGGGRDEIAVLTKALNYLSDRLYNTIKKLEKSHKREENARLGAEQASNLKSNFLARLSPELRTPLNAISGYVEIIRNDLNSGRYDAALYARIESIAENAELLKRQVANLLDIGKLGTEKKYLDITEFNTGDFMRELLEYSIFCLQEKDITLVNHMSHRVPEKISTDRELLSLVLGTLIRALARVSGPGEIISCGCEPAEDKLVFWVRDNRRTEPQENLAALFRRLTPEADFTKTATPSVLNMMFASEKAASLNAELNAASHEDAACEFTLTFQAWDVVSESVVETPKSHIVSNYQQQDEEDFDESEGDYEAVTDFKLEAELFPGNVRILLAENDRDNAEILNNLLTADGGEVCVVDNGGDCMKILGEGNADILILSLLLPETDVVGLIKKIRKTKNIEKLPVIVLAGYLSQHDRQRLIVAGANRCFIKPLNFQKLRQLIKTLTGSPEN
ncbi:MAG: hybrid sensor histidine kinase/response regulator [Victivallaceae bacterium]|nr:hybrid sensor histidine kinase/response regulator [Victivallaceae bacterium]